MHDSRVQGGSAPADGMAVTLILAFPPTSASIPAVVTTLVDAGPALVAECHGLFDQWHSSRHSRVGQYSQLWFRFRCSDVQVHQLIERASAWLGAAQARYGFTLSDPIVQPELEALGAGDCRQGYDIVKAIGGPSSLPRLWAEVEQATEWAIADLRNRAPQRVLPSHWFPWSRHIYLNALGLE